MSHVRRKRKGIPCTGVQFAVRLEAAGWRTAVLYCPLGGSQIGVSGVIYRLNLLLLATLHGTPSKIKTLRLGIQHV